MKFAIGEWVRYHTPKGAIEGHRAFGRVDAAERYEDDNGVRDWIYVRFVNADGQPDQNPTKCHAYELELIAKN